DFLTSITAKDASLLGEVPIPNANTTGLFGPRSGCGVLNPGEFGRADLYQATNNKVIGYGFKEVKGADNIPRPWSSPDFGTMGCTTTDKARLDPVPITFFSSIVEGGARRSGKRSSDTAPTWDGATFDN